MFSPYHTSGFYCAAATKGFLTILILASVVINVPLSSYRQWFTVTYSTIFEDLKLEKYLASRCVFLDPKDILCASVLLYHFRIFERRYGSSKFVSYLAGTWLLSLAIELTSVFVLKLVDVNVTSIQTGPWGVVFALFVPYFCDIPRVAVTHIWGIPFTGKSITYIIGLQMMSSSLESMLLAVCGLLSGVLYKHDLLYIQSWLRVPRPMGKLAEYSLGRLFYTPCPADLELPMGATLEIQRVQHIERLEQQMMWAQLSRQNGNGGRSIFGRRNQQLSAEPAEDQIRLLVDMGFPRDRVIQALRQSNNDTEQAAGFLLMH